jgi:hypothetical protein
LDVEGAALDDDDCVAPFRLIEREIPPAFDRHVADVESATGWVRVRRWSLAGQVD